MTTHPYLPHEKLLDLLLDVVCIVDVEGRFLSVSAASERVFGYRPDEMIGRTAFEFIHPDDRDASRALVERINSGEPSHDHENRYVHKDGHIVHIMWSAQWLEAEQVRVGVARDITARKRAEAMQAALYTVSEAAHTAGDLQTLYAQVHEVIGRLLPAENFFVALYDPAIDELSFPYYVDQFDRPPQPQRLDSGTLSAEVIRTGEAVLLTPETAEQTLAKIGSVAGKHSLDWLGVPLEAGTEIIGALVLQSYSGAVRYTEQNKELLQFVSSQVATAIERKRTHSRLEFLARYDHLTELPNRALFLDRLQNSLQRAQRDDLRLAVLYLDMDNFKQINDTFGHTTGDRLLQEVAQRLKQCVRESDTIGRLGGDEFAVLLDNIGKREDATLVADKIIATLSNPYILNDKTVISSPSLGIAIYPEHADDELELVRLADEAMYVAKRDGGKRFKIAAITAIANDQLNPTTYTTRPAPTSPNRE
ncbi:sensor domain-containing diguanylate cyclase [Halopseudomonas pelagia]|uniref:Diguanylate cyclase n=1 Tax=Halopseudomonas pelagia TaxID=553151 RepID=A0AA91U0L4_9GAMM|nr:sensor domain-containing diguanylate cyclase [Halopseudomonas pelagia]PCC98322.1 diguanylate cyclase [Halopseudomonas pelagia]QFY58766.1 sensor domain-containing diguanylate cyclase [Halopseudomonas pelagia]